MSLNIQVGDVTQPGATGQQTYSLPSNFDPKALTLIATPLAADGVGASGVPASMCVGFGTYRGAAVQMHYVGVAAQDNVGTSNAFRVMNTDAIIKLMDGTGAVDLEIDLVSMQTGSTSNFVLDWVNLHTTASVRVQYICFGGSDVTDALAHEITTTSGAGTQDVALTSFGHPDVVFLMRMASTNGAVETAGADFGLGFGVRGGSNRSVWWGTQDAAATEASFQRIDNDSALIAGANGTIETDLALAAEAGWPTDGYRLTKTTSSFSGEIIKGLAIKFSGNVVITSGEGSMRTTTGNTDLAVGSSTPKGLVLLHTRTATANTTDSTSTDAAEVGIGLVDGAGNERWSAIYDDDGQATASVASSAQSTTKALRLYLPSSDTLDTEADGVVSGSNFQLQFTDAAPSAFLYEWLAFGESSGTVNATVTATTLAGTGALPVPAVAAGSSVAPAALAGTGDAIAPTVASLASVTAPALAGTGDAVTPTVTASATVVAPPLGATGAVPPVNGIVSSVVNAPAITVSGALPAPSVSAGSNATVTAPPLAATGDALAPTLAAGSSVTAPALAAVGDAPAPVLAAGATLTAPVLLGAGALVSPFINGGANANVTAPPLTGTGDVVAPAIGAGAQIVTTPAGGIGGVAAPVAAAGSAVTSPPLTGTGDVVAPMVVAGGSATVDAVPLAASGDVPAPALAISHAVVAPALAGSGAVFQGEATAGALIAAIPLMGSGACVPADALGLVVGLYTGTGRASSGRIAVAPAGRLAT